MPFPVSGSPHTHLHTLRQLCQYLRQRRGGIISGAAVCTYDIVLLISAECHAVGLVHDINATKEYLMVFPHQYRILELQRRDLLA